MEEAVPGRVVSLGVDDRGAEQELLFLLLPFLSSSVFCGKTATLAHTATPFLPPSSAGLSGGH